MLKKIFSSKLFKIIISVVLIYFAFRKVNVLDILNKLKQVSVWFVFVNLIISFFLTFLISYRWNLLLFKESSWKKIFDLTKANYISGFYALISSTAAVGDLVKWIPLQKKYPDSTNKTILLGSVLIDRLIAFTTFTFMAFVSTLIGKLMGFKFPDFLFWLFGCLFLGVMIFYILVFVFNVRKFSVKNKFLDKLLNKAEQVIDLLKDADKKRLLLSLAVSLFCEILWAFSIWFISLFFNSGLSLLSFFIFMPIISLILILPISVAGFGGREVLFLYFFTQLGIGDEKILLVSTFIGVILVLNGLLGGLLLF